MVIYYTHLLLLYLYFIYQGQCLTVSLRSKKEGLSTVRKNVRGLNLEMLLILNMFDNPILVI